MGLTLDEIKSAPKVQRVDTPEWGGDGHVFVRVLPASFADDILAWVQDETRDEKTTLIQMAQWCVCDEQGTPILEAEPLEAIAELAWLPLQRCALAAMRLNGITLDAEAETEKN